MKKQEQIEEMGQIICGRSKDGICLIDKTSCDSICNWARQAEAIYNAGYRKIDDDCAVITKAELKQYKAQAVKEFAEKVKEKALSHCRTINCYECKFVETTIDELLEVEE